MDGDGMDPKDLDEQLSKANAAAAASGSKPPRLMYIVPVAHNPTGIVLSLERKQKIYEVWGPDWEVWEMWERHTAIPAGLGRVAGQAMHGCGWNLSWPD